MGGGRKQRYVRGGGRELRLLYCYNQYTQLQNRDNSGLLGTPVYYSLKLGGPCLPTLKLGGGGGGGGGGGAPLPPRPPPLPRGVALSQG